LAFGVTLFSAIGVWVACGGSDPQDVTAPDAGNGDTSRPSEPEDSGDNEPFDSGGPKDAAPEARPERDSGTPLVLFPDGGPFAEAGIQCYVGGQLEEEPNNTQATANTLAPIRCGFVEVPDGGQADAEADWMTFNVSDAATGFFVKYEGNVKVFVETDGMAPVDITQPGASIKVFSKTQPYFVQVQSGNGQSQLWRVILFEDK